MVELVDSIDLSTNVELLDSVVQVLNGGVLLITTENILSFLLPRVVENLVSKIFFNGNPYGERNKGRLTCLVGKRRQRLGWPSYGHL